MNEPKSSRTAATSKGLAKLRHLQESAPSESKKNANLPSGWFYNEQNENEFWDEMEKGNDQAHYAALEASSRKAQNITNIGDSSKKIKDMLDGFSQIDSDFLVQLMQLAPEQDQDDTVDSNAILDSMRNQVFQYCSDISDISKNQEEIITSIRTWFTSLEKTDIFLNKEMSSTEEGHVNIQEVYDKFQEIMADAAAKTERASVIHNDVTQFWQKQIVALKQIISQKNGQIAELNELMDAAAQAKARKQKKKQAQAEKEKELEVQQGNIERLVRQIEEQKLQIQSLKQTIINSKAENAMMAVQNMVSSGTTKTDIDTSDFQNYKYEADAKIVLLEEQVKHLIEENEQLNNKLENSNLKEKKLEKSITEKDQKINDLESNVQKYINLLSLEREKPTKIIRETKEAKNDELYLEIVKLKEQLSQERNEHQLQIKSIQEIERQRNAAERNKLFDALTAQDPSSNVGSLLADYEKKLSSQKEDFDNLVKNLTTDFGAKIAILTKQYESRIKTMNEEHQEELIDAQNSLSFEIKKAKLTLADDFNMQLSEATKTHAEHESRMKQTIEQLEQKLDKISGEKQLLLDTVTKLTGEQQPLQSSGISTSRSTTSIKSVADVNSETKHIENYLQKRKIEKQEMEEQNEWALKQAQRSFEQKLKKQMEEEQEKQRQLLQKILVSLGKLEKDEKDSISLKEAIASVTDAFLSLNKSLEEASSQQIMIPIEEANRRTKILNDRIIKLQAELEDLSPNTMINYTDEIERLNKKINFLESVKRGDETGMMKEYRELQEKFTKELDEKNALIEELTHADQLDTVFYGEFYATEVFSCYTEEGYEYEEDDYDQPVFKRPLPLPFRREEKNIPLDIDDDIIRSTPEFIDNPHVVDEENDEKTPINIKVPQLPLKRIPSNESYTEIQNVLLDESEKVVVPAVITVESQSGRKTKEVRTIAKTDASKQEKQIKRTIKVKNDKLPLTPSVFKRAIPPIPISPTNKDGNSSVTPKNSGRSRSGRKSARMVVASDPSPKKEKKAPLSISFNSVSYNVPVRHELYIAPGSRKSIASFVHVDVFGLRPGRKPPLIVESDSFAESIIQDLQNYLKKLACAQMTVTGEQDYAKEEFLNLMKVALVDSNQRIILSDKNLCTEYRENEGDDNENRVEFNDATIEPKKNLMEEQMQNMQMLENGNNQEELYQRPAPTPLELDLSDLNTPLEVLVDDPFTSSITMFAEIIRFINGFKDNQKYIKQTLTSDINAYEAYIRAVDENIDQTTNNYLAQIKESNECYTQNSQQIDKLQEMCMKTLNVLRESKRVGKLLKEKAEKSNYSAAGEHLKTQEMILRDIHAETGVNEKLPESVKQLITLDKIDAALNLVDEIDIPLSENDRNSFEFLKRRLAEKKTMLKEGKTVEQRDIEYLLGVTEDLIAAVKPNVMKPREEFEKKLTEEKEKAVDEIKAKAHKYKNAYIKDHHELKQCKSKLGVLEKQLKIFKERLQEEKEANQNTVSLYQAQIQTLKGIFEKLTSEQAAASKTPSELAADVMKEVSNLQDLIESSVNEKEALRLRASSTQELALTREEEIEELKSEKEGLEKQINELKESISKNNEIVLFHEVDLANIQKERDADSQLDMEHQKQLNNALQNNSKLREDMIDLEKQIQQLKWSISQKDDQIDELNIRVALGSYQDTKTRKSVLTQTVLRLVPKTREKKDVIEEESEEKPVNSKVNFNLSSTDFSNSISVSEDSAAVRGSFQSPKLSNSLTIPAFGQLSSSQELTKSPQAEDFTRTAIHDSVPYINLSMPRGSSLKMAPDEPIEEDDYVWEEAPVEEDNDRFSSQIIEVEREETAPNIMIEKAPEVVHQPLNWAKKKGRRTSIIEATMAIKGKQIKKPMQSQTKTPRAKTSFANSQTDKLVIGDVLPGVRPLKGKIGKVHPTTTVQTATEMKAALSIHPTEVTGIETSRTFKSEPPKTSRTAKSSPKKRIEPINGVPEYNPNDFETIRITNVKYEAMSKTPRSVAPAAIIKPIESSCVNCDPMSTSPTAPTPLQSQSSVIEELKRIAAKLRETVAKQNEEIEEKDNLIVDLKKKLSESLKQGQQTKVDVLRIEDKAKRLNIRYENVQNRLEIAMKELGYREETISDLKREIIKLKSVIPSKEILDKLNNAREEQRRLKKEAERQKELLKISERSLNSAESKKESVKQHLLTLMDNTQKSLHRTEAKRRMWKDVERKQVMGALSALSLISNDTFDVRAIDELISQRKNPIYGLLASRKTNQDEDEDDENILQ